MPLLSKIRSNIAETNNTKIKGQFNGCPKHPALWCCPFRLYTV